MTDYISIVNLIMTSLNILIIPIFIKLLDIFDYMAKHTVKSQCCCCNSEFRKESTSQLLKASHNNEDPHINVPKQSLMSI